MIGVTKKPSCIRLAMMSRRSRNSTDADDTVNATPATNSVCSSMSTGAKRMLMPGVNLPSAANRIGTASAKWTRCESTTTIGSASAGNMTFLISAAFAEIELVDSSTAAAKKVQGRIPEKRNSGYGCTTCCGKNLVKTIVYTASSSSGFASDQK